MLGLLGLLAVGLDLGRRLGLGLGLGLIGPRTRLRIIRLLICGLSVVISGESDTSLGTVMRRSGVLLIMRRPAIVPG